MLQPPVPSPPAVPRWQDTPYAVGPERMHWDLASPTWWQGLWAALRTPRGPHEDTPDALPSWIASAWWTALETKKLGPTGPALTWATFREGVETLEALPPVRRRPEMLHLWLAWHGTGRASAAEPLGTDTAQPRPWHVWQEAGVQEAARREVVETVLALTDLLHASLRDAQTPTVQSVVANLPWRDLGIPDPARAWPLLIRRLAVWSESPEGASSKDRTVGEPPPPEVIGGWWRRVLTWLAPPEPANSPLIAGQDLRTHWARMLLTGLGRRSDWPPEALAALRAVYPASGVLATLAPQEMLPVGLIREVVEEAAVRLPAGQGQPNQVLQRLAIALRHVAPTGSAARDMTEAELSLVSRAVAVGLMGDQMTRAYGKARGAFAQVGVDLELSEWQETLPRVLRHDQVAGRLDHALWRHLLSHPSARVREAAIGALGRLRGGAMRDPTGLVPDVPATSADPSPRFLR